MPDSKIITRRLLNKFIEQQKLSGAVAFLRFLIKKNNLRSFYSFLGGGSYLPVAPDQASKSVLFHGSQKKQSVLVPSASVARGGKAERQRRVYATDDPNYAIFLAVLRLRNGSASVNVTRRGTALTVDLDFINGPSKLKDGYVHIVADTAFKRAGNREYTADRRIEVLFTIPVTPQDLTVPIYVQTESL